jgi:hypothetical protein
LPCGLAGASYRLLEWLAIRRGRLALAAYWKYVSDLATGYCGPCPEGFTDAALPCVLYDVGECDDFCGRCPRRVNR